MIYDINDRSTYARFKITGASTDDNGFVKLAVAHLASNNTFSAADELSITFVRNGDTGNTGATGSQGTKGVNGLAMTFSSSTSTTDPGAGKVAFNNATVSSVSILTIDDVDDAGVNVSTFVQSWDDIVNATARGIITVRKEATPTTFATFKVTGAVSNESGFSKVVVTHIVSSGSFTNLDGIGVEFSYSGTDGSGITDVVADTSPQLGGTLDTNEKTISTVSNRALELAPNGTGTVVVKGNTNSGAIKFNCESNTHGQTVKAQPHSASVTNSLLLPAGADSTLVSLVSIDTLTNKTLTSPKINENVAVTSTATELNLLDGVSGLVQADFTKLAAVTASASELNTLTGVTAVVAEINSLDIGSTAIGTAVASKAVILDANKDYTGIRNVGLTGTLGVAGISSFAVAANVAQTTLSSSSNAVAWDSSAKPNAVHVTTENTTFSAPSNSVEGAFICVEINYNGSHSIAWNTVFEFAASTAPTFTSADGKTDIMVFRYNGAVWQEVGRTINLSES